MKVTLIGAGPGDEGLLTVKGAKSLAAADVVLYDRLVGREILNMIPDAAEKINVGKNVNNHPIPQDQINELILEKAKQGLNVVRLKGGESFLFGRGGEELEKVAAEGIPFEVIPGIPSAIAAGTYAGIPVTHRDFASSLHLITGHAKAGSALDIDFEALVRAKGTLVFMMSVSTAGEIAKGCLSAGMFPEMPVAVVENATTSHQRKFLGTLQTLEQMIIENKVKSPAVIIIGKVVSLSETLDWFGQKPLKGKKIVVTRARTSKSDLSEKLKELGCDVIQAPSIKLQPLLKGNAQVENALSNIESYKWMVFTSAAAVNLFFDHLLEIEYDVRKFYHLKIAAVGQETKKEIAKRGIRADYVPEEYYGVSLAKGLIPLIKADEKLVIFRAKIGSEDMLDVFSEAGIDFENIPIYDTVYEIIEESGSLAEMIAEGEIDFVTFTSSSTVEGFIKTIGTIDLSKIKGICIGKRTADTAIGYGIQTLVSEKATIDSMIEKILEVSSNDQ